MLKREKILHFFQIIETKELQLNFLEQKQYLLQVQPTLALRYDRPLILGYCTFNRDNTTSVHFKKIDVINDKDKSFKENVHLTTQKLISIMEDIITCYPEQWMWLTDRWKLYKVVSKKKKK